MPKVRTQTWWLLQCGRWACYSCQPQACFQNQSKLANRTSYWWEHYALLDIAASPIWRQWVSMTPRWPLEKSPRWWVQNPPAAPAGATPLLEPVTRGKKTEQMLILSKLSRKAFVMGGPWCKYPSGEQNRFAAASRGWSCTKEWTQSR